VSGEALAFQESSYMRKGRNKATLRKKGDKIGRSKLRTARLSPSVELGALRLSKGLPKSPNSELQRGFTLIEIIIVIVILSIVSAITIKFLVDSLTIYTMTVDQKTLFDEGKLALERMCRDIRDANSITTPASGGSSSSGTLLSFTRTNATAQDSAGDTIQFILSAGTLQRKASTRSTVDLASYVTAITVTRGTSPNNEITISLTLSRPSTGVTLSVPLQTKVIPKNFSRDTTYKYFKNYWQEEQST
jgi:prepilin-type N-terminal cleavage/methylation domain-containing protein